MLCSHGYLVAMVPHFLQVYSRTYISVSPSPDVWAFGVIATHVFLGRNREEQEQDVRLLLFTVLYDTLRASTGCSDILSNS